MFNTPSLRLTVLTLSLTSVTPTGRCGALPVALYLRYLIADSWQVWLASDVALVRGKGELNAIISVRYASYVSASLSAISSLLSVYHYAYGMSMSYPQLCVYFVVVI